MSTELPPGKAAIIKWMRATSEGMSREHVDMAISYVMATEYIVGLEGFIDNVHDVGWSDTQIEDYARQLAEACVLIDDDPRPEHLSDRQIDDFVEQFTRAAGYRGKLR